MTNMGLCDPTHQVAVNDTPPNVPAGAERKALVQTTDRLTICMPLRASGTSGLCTESPNRNPNWIEACAGRPRTLCCGCNCLRSLLRFDKLVDQNGPCLCTTLRVSERERNAKGAEDCRLGRSSKNQA
jgi:hypothetical protein